MAEKFGFHNLKVDLCWDTHADPHMIIKCTLCDQLVNNNSWDELDLSELFHMFINHAFTYHSFNPEKIA